MRGTQSISPCNNLSSDPGYSTIRPYSILTQIHLSLCRSACSIQTGLLQWMSNHWSLFASHSGLRKWKLSQWISDTSQIVHITIIDNSEVAQDISSRYECNFS